MNEATFRGFVRSLDRHNGSRLDGSLSIFNHKKLRRAGGTPRDSPSRLSRTTIGVGIVSRSAHGGDGVRRVAGRLAAR
jgi:hypothetical protein